MATPQISWARVLVEGVVIVASILLALTADAWWEERQEREEEAALLESLSAELRLNADSLMLWQDTLGFALRRADELIHFTGPDAEAMEAVEFSTRFLEAVSWRTLHPSTGAMSAARERLSLIRSEELRAEIQQRVSAGLSERSSVWS